MSLINAFIINCCLEVTPSHRTLHKKSRWYLKGYGKRAFQRSNRTSIKWAEKLLFSFPFSFFSLSMRECGLWIIVWSIVQVLKCFLVSNFYVVLGNEPGNWIPFVPIKNCAQCTYLCNIIFRPKEICLPLPWKESLLISRISLDQLAKMRMTLKKIALQFCHILYKQIKKWIYCGIDSLSLFCLQCWIPFFIRLPENLLSPGMMGPERLCILM